MSNFVNVVVAIIQNTKGEYLLSQRNYPTLPEVHLKWQLPGGKIEFGETTEETLQRECAEELGQEVHILKTTPSVKTHMWHHTNREPQHTLLIGYLCELVDEEKEIKLNHETNDYKWFTIEEIKNLDRLPHSLEMIEELRN